MTLKTPRKTFTHIVFCAVLVYAPCGFAVPSRAANAGEAEKAFAVVPFETLGVGNESGCLKRALFAINDEAEWQRVWGVHTQGIAEAQHLPKVDFARQSVIAILSGARSDKKSLQIAQVVRGVKETVVYFMTGDEKSWLGVPEVQAKEESAAAQPYIFVAVDKISTPLRFSDVFAAENTCSKCAG